MAVFLSINLDEVAKLPGAGAKGGQVIAEGTVPEITENTDSPIGTFLSGRADMHVRDQADALTLFSAGHIHFVTYAIPYIKPKIFFQYRKAALPDL